MGSQLHSSRQHIRGTCSTGGTIQTNTSWSDVVTEIGLRWNFKPMKSLPEIVQDLYRDDCTAIPYSESCCHVHWKKKAGSIPVLHSSTLLGCSSYFFHSDCCYMGRANATNRWIKSPKLSCGIHRVFHSQIAHVHPTPVYTDCKRLRIAEVNRRVHPLHLCFPYISESPSNNYSFRLSNEL